jgi:hypothetical protein
MLGRRLARLLRPVPLVPLAALGLGAVELAIADRKYGVFTSGFGTSSAVDRPGELALFAAGYLVSQAFAALLAWWLCAKLARNRPGWQALLGFAFLYLGLGLLALTAQYQLHSYFSDAVSFALLKQLGGGSLADALLFGKNEIAWGLAALAALALAWWLASRLARRFAGALPAEPARPPRGRWLAACTALLALALVAVPRIAEDSARGLQRTLAWQAAANLAALATDFDRDGYGLVGLATDAHPFDPARHPLALDVPGNGIDEDGYGGDLQLVTVPEARPALAGLDTRPHVVIVVLESVRTDVLGKRIGGRPVAPNLEALAAAGGAVAPAYSHVGFTTASLKSIFAGRLAPRRGDPSLFAELRRAGYRIGVFSGQPEDFGDISDTVAMRENAEVFVDAETLRDERAFSFAAQGSLLVDEAILLREFDRALGASEAWSEPRFVYLNFQSAHFPYHHPGVSERVGKPLPRSEITAANKERVAETYWNALAHADTHLGLLIDRLRRLGVWDETILLVTGDHGEALFEDGFLGHGHVIDDAQYATFLVASRPLGGLAGPIALSDYRGILLDLIAGRPPVPPAQRPFMHIGELEAPSAIALVDDRFGIVSLRLDRGETCFARPSRHCLSWNALGGERKAAAERVVARWGSERWAVSGKARAASPAITRR